jgi:ABC-2 type transport system permease protein
VSLRLVAVKDVRDAVRERELHVLLALFLAVGLGVGYFFTTSDPEADATAGFVVSTAVLLSFLVPLAALSVSQASLVGKRIRGELKVMLGLPFSRAELVGGTFLGRTAVVLSALLAAAVPAFVLATLTGARVGVVGYGLSVLADAVLAVAFVSIAVGISASARDTTRSSAAAFGVFLLFVFRVWDLLPSGVVYVLNGFSSPGTTPEWVIAFGQVDPLTAYGNVVAGLIPAARESLALLGVGGAGPGGPAVYETPWFAAAVLAVWIVVPLALGYRRFEGTDL